MCEETKLVFLVYLSKMKQNSISQLGAHNQLAFAQLTVRCNPSSNSTVQILTLLSSGSKFRDTEEKDRACSLSTSSLCKSFIHTQKTQNIYFVHLLSTFQKGKKRGTGGRREASYSNCSSQIWQPGPIPNTEPSVNGSSKSHDSTLSHCLFFSCKGTVITKLAVPLLYHSFRT